MIQSIEVHLSQLSDDILFQFLILFRQTFALTKFSTTLINELQPLIDNLDISTVLFHECFGICDLETVETNCKRFLLTILLVVLNTFLIAIQILCILILQLIQLRFQLSQFSQRLTGHDLICTDRLQGEFNRIYSTLHITLSQTFRIFTFTLEIGIQLTILKLLFTRPFDLFVGHLQKIVHIAVQKIIGSLANEAPSIKLFLYQFKLFLNHFSLGIDGIFTEHIVQRHSFCNDLDRVRLASHRSDPAFLQEILSLFESFHLSNCLRDIHPINIAKDFIQDRTGTLIHADVLMELRQIIFDGSFIISLDPMERHQADTSHNERSICFLNHSDDHCLLFRHSLVRNNGRKIKDRVRAKR